ncbi:11527_t:CDS:2 [Entrophospora sp. SA101]|nr:11527_t:CDS:2 [Entrophospora sp. SA101]
MLKHPASEADTNLYGALKQTFENIDLSSLMWEDPEASMVLSDNSDIVKNLECRQKSTFLGPWENMKCIIPGSKETESELIKITDCILGTLCEIWNNPAFTTSASHSEQSEETYITDVIIPLLQSSLGGLPNGCICLSTSEYQSLASTSQ